MSNNSIAVFLNSKEVSERIAQSLGERKQQFITSVISLVSANQALAECDRRSLMSACMIAATLNLPINQNMGFAYILPYNNRKTGTKEAQFQMGYKGFVQLAMRSGQFKKLNVTDVRSGEIEKIDRLTGDITFNWADEREGLEVVGYVAYMELINGFSKSLYMTKAELTTHGVKFSQTFKKGYGLWKDDFDSMAKKTVIKLLLSKYAPMNTEMEQAQIADQAVLKGEEVTYPDNQQLTAGEQASEKEKDWVLQNIKEAGTLAELEKCKPGVGEDEELLSAYTEREAFLSIPEEK